jgi:hypothetical protein
MNIKLETRQIEPGRYYITINEALRLCSEADPQKKLHRLPKKGYERKVKYNGKNYWLGRVAIDDKIAWIMESEDGL